MIAVLRGIKNVEYTKRDTGEHKVGIELHLERRPYPSEPFVAGSDVVFTEYISVNPNSQNLVDSILSMPIGSEVDLQYVQTGRFSNLVSVVLAK